MVHALYRGGSAAYRPAMTSQPDSILIVDFGSQVTQLIARRVREAGVYSEIAPFNRADEAFARLQPKGIILSGGPSSVMWDDSPRAPQHFFDAGLPILAICYGQQTMAHQLGGRVAPSDNREFGRAFIEITGDSVLFDGLWKQGETPPGLDEPWRPGRGAARGLQRRRRLRRRALCGRHRRGAPLLQPDVPPRGRPHARRRQVARQFRPPRLRPAGRLDDGRISRDQDRRHPRPGRAGQGDLRPFRRRRQRGRRGADPRGDRPSADLRLRRSRPDAGKRGRAGRLAVPQPLQHPARPCGRGGPVPRRPRRARRAGGQAQADRQDLHRHFRGGGRARSAAPISSPRARSIPT